MIGAGRTSPPSEQALRPSGRCNARHEGAQLAASHPMAISRVGGYALFGRSVVTSVSATLGRRTPPTSGSASTLERGAIAHAPRP